MSTLHLLQQLGATNLPDSVISDLNRENDSPGPAGTVGAGVDHSEELQRAIGRMIDELVEERVKEAISHLP